ncbi:RNA polymerase sigma factor [Granulicella arctica]|uniref:RNA polymerase sigma factor n=1 Tax=Granulicella arctica TaxID=940613 RepID=UPI0021E054AB|nr:RNA polymerase sigma factor [Granulicella arctica]
MTEDVKVVKDWARNAEMFGSVYREYAPRLRAFLRQIVGSFQAAEDLTQEVFTQLWRHPDGFDPARGSVGAYLFGIGRHRAAEWWRRTKSESPVQEEILMSCDLEQGSMVSDALQHLPEEQRTLIWLREVEGHSYAELAVMLDIPIGTVRSRLFMARQALRTIWLGAAKGELHEVR